MPFYEYQCASCGHQLEVLQKLSDPPLRKCPACARRTLTKLVSAPVFRLKGSGWYETDFKSDAEGKRNLVGEKEEAPPKAEAADKPASEKTDAKADAKADAKPDAKPDAKAESTKAEPAAKGDSGKTQSDKGGSGKADASGKRAKRKTSLKQPKPAARPAKRKAAR